MRPEHWSQVKRLFEAARPKPPRERATFLDEQSGLDPGLREKVERLLAADRDDSFLQGLPEEDYL